MMGDNPYILGCYLSGPYLGNTEQLRQEAREQCDLFQNYIWGKNGIDKALKKLRNRDYGIDINLALFEFYIKPLLVQQQYLKEIGRFRPKEKSVGMPIIITDQNFFSKTDSERYDFLKESIFQKIDLLEKLVKRRKFDTNIELLRNDLKKQIELLGI